MIHIAQGVRLARCYLQMLSAALMCSRSDGRATGVFSVDAVTFVISSPNGTGGRIVPV